MRIAIAVDQFYDWAPVPQDASVTEADVAAKRVKPAHGGGWLMRVTRKMNTETLVQIPEEQIIHFIVGDMVRDRMAHDRHQAVALHLGRNVMPHHAHRHWMRGITVEDDGPDEKLFLSIVDRQVAAGNLTSYDREDLLTAYMKKTTKESHSLHLHKHFGVKSQVEKQAEKQGSSK